MRRIIISSAATISGVVLLLSLKPHSTATTSSASISTGSSQSSSSTTGGTSASPSPSASSSSSSTSSGSGSSTSTQTFTGTAAQTRFGPVQVKITVKNKKITNIEVVEYPSDNPKDQEINNYALPVLNQEAISAQSAQIDSVSGATFTSDGYVSSLQSAIDQAGL
ncbi:FMN-binding protein [Streptomyces sp. NBC_01262]|uniref:FMN-binding protein n=1 Tax=Streptomyces sp. NBC_01262 TaxID=2903803 RepID=UPI002E339949|nr:FMN-binding protein [Streptomyces sp. NBC_01262]